MNRKTAQALQEIDRGFYEECADAFDATRQRPWNGFAEILDCVSAPLSILDLGCGNGRFAQALADRLLVERYVGIDQSAALLSRAETLKLPFKTDFRQGDLLSPGCQWPSGSFSLVVALGLMHHIPGFSQRRALLQNAAMQLSPAGLLAVSFYRYDRSPRMMRRLIEPHSQPEFAELPATEFETGDYLIPFGETGRVRYCHLFSDAEINELSHICGLTCTHRFTPATGSDRLNDYLLWRRPADDAAGSIQGHNKPS